MKMLRRAEVQDRNGSSRSSLYEQVANGLLTVPIKINGSRASGWPDHEIDLITAARIAGKSDSDVRALVSDLHAARQTRYQALLSGFPEPTDISLTATDSRFASRSRGAE
jgi:prophage regulatory protein